MIEGTVVILGQAPQAGEAQVPGPGNPCAAQLLAGRLALDPEARGQHPPYPVQELPEEKHDQALGESQVQALVQRETCGEAGVLGDPVVADAGCRALTLQ